MNLINNNAKSSFVRLEKGKLFFFIWTNDQSVISPKGSWMIPINFSKLDKTCEKKQMVFYSIQKSEA